MYSGLNSHRLRRLLVVLSALVLWGAQGHALASAADHVPTPVVVQVGNDEEIVLRVRGASGSRSFTLAALERTGMYRVRTSTFWPGDDGVFEGPLLAHVLREAGVGAAAAVRVTALDGFSQVLPATDWQRWPVMLATRHRGEPMSVRAKGPLRIIYPRDMDAELQQPGYRLRWVWVVSDIEAVEP